MTLEPLPGGADLQLPAGHMLGSVNLSDVWSGRIEVRLTNGLAHQTTATVLMISRDAMSEAETLDAIREIANMIGGVIPDKHVFAASPRLSRLTLVSSLLPYAASIYF